jgi:hypothetical protein
VAFLATAFDRLWRLAVPMYPQAAEPVAPDGITPRQRAIATLLVEGHTDAVIATAGAEHPYRPGAHRQARGDARQ